MKTADIGNRAFLMSLFKLAKKKQETEEHYTEKKIQFGKEKLWNHIIMHLWDCVLVQLGVLACHMDHVEGNDIGHSLHFMDDCIGIGQVFSVRQRRLSGWTNNSIYLSLDFLYTQWKQGTMWVSVLQRGQSEKMCAHMPKTRLARETPLTGL